MDLHRWGEGHARYELFCIAVSFQPPSPLWKRSGRQGLGLRSLILPKARNKERAVKSAETRWPQVGMDITRTI